MSKIADDLLLDEALKAEEYLRQSRTALDTKAGSVYAAAAVLAVQPSILLIAPNVTILVLVIQCLGYIFLAGSIYWAYEALDLTRFPITSVIENQRFRDKTVLDAGHNATDDEIRADVLSGLLDAATFRIAIAERSNKLKASKVSSAFTWLFLALLTNTGAFLIHLVCRYLAFQYPLHP